MAPDNADAFTLKHHWRWLLTATLVSISTFQYGLDFGVIGGLQAMVGFLQVFGEPDPNSPIGYNIDSGRQRLISSLMTLGAFVTSATAGITSRWIGRKLSLWIACVLVAVSTAMMQATENINVVYVGRLLLGFGNGMLMTQSQLYIQESSPARYRGLAISFFQYWTSIGTLVGTIIDNYTSKYEGKSSYIVSLGMVYIVPGLLSIGIIFIPESPRWLLTHGHEARALKALRWIRPKAWAVDAEFAEIKAALEAEQAINSSVGFRDLFANPIDSRRSMLAIASVTYQAASGAMFMIAYGTYFFTMAKIGTPFEDSVIATGTGVAAILINSAIVTRWGYRRQMLMIGLFACGVCQLIVAAVYTAQPGTEQTGKIIVGFSILYLCIYNCFIATYAWVGGGEIPSQRLRSHTFGIAAAVGFFFAWLTTFTAPYFINPDSLNWSAKYGYIWLPSCWLTAVWVFFLHPETKDRTLEEIDELFEARVPARKFSSYVCTGQVNTLSGSKSGDSKDAVEEKVERMDSS